MDDFAKKITEIIESRKAKEESNFYLLRITVQHERCENYSDLFKKIIASWGANLCLLTKNTFYIVIDAVTFTVLNATTKIRYTTYIEIVSAFSAFLFSELNAELENFQANVYFVKTASELLVTLYSFAKKHSQCYRRVSSKSDEKIKGDGIEEIRNLYKIDVDSYEKMTKLLFPTLEKIE